MEEGKYCEHKTRLKNLNHTFKDSAPKNRFNITCVFYNFYM